MVPASSLRPSRPRTQRDVCCEQRGPENPAIAPMSPLIEQAVGLQEARSIL